MLIRGAFLRPPSLPRQVEVRAFRKEQWKDGNVNNPRRGASKMLKVAESVSLFPFPSPSPSPFLAPLLFGSSDLHWIPAEMLVISNRVRLNTRGNNRLTYPCVYHIPCTKYICIRDTRLISDVLILMNWKGNKVRGIYIQVDSPISDDSSFFKL